MAKPETEIQTPRNSAVREMIAKPTTKIVELLSKAFPWLTPNEITFLGTAGVGALVLYTSQQEKDGAIDFKSALSLVGAFFALSGTDALDGALARYQRENGDTSHDSRVGQWVDSLSDRVQEAFLAWLAMYRAAEQGDKLWLLTATLTALTNPLSSLVRAWAESQGVVVPESGTNAFEFLGTRGGRFATSITRFLPAPKVRGVSGQAVIDGVSAAATTKTTLGRLKTIRQAQHSDEGTHHLDDQTQVDAKKRFRLLAGLYTITGTVTGLLLYKVLQNKKPLI